MMLNGKYLCAKRVQIISSHISILYHTFYWVHIQSCFHICIWPCLITAHSPRWRRVVSAIRFPPHSLFPPNMTTILKFDPDPNTVAVCSYRGPTSCGRVTCTGGGNSNWWNILYITYCVSVYTSIASTLEHTLFRCANYAIHKYESMYIWYIHSLVIFYCSSLHKRFKQCCGQGGGGQQVQFAPGT